MNPSVKFNHRIVIAELFHAGLRHLTISETMAMVLGFFIELYRTKGRAKATKGKTTVLKVI